MIDEEIVAFINENKVATVCASVNNEPYCFNCYYSFMEQDGLLVYKSSTGTKHDKMLVENNKTAGTIVPENTEVTSIRGIQFEGLVLKERFELSLKLSASYYLKYPFAMAMPGTLFAIQINKMKFTDNTRGFGFKQNWERKN
jgi:hypothetical protein